MRLVCPACHSRLKVPGGSKGRSVQCPACGHITVPPTVLLPPNPTVLEVRRPPTRRPKTFPEWLTVTVLVLLALVLLSSPLVYFRPSYQYDPADYPEAKAKAGELVGQFIRTGGKDSYDGTSVRVYFGALAMHLTIDEKERICRAYSLHYSPDHRSLPPVYIHSLQTGKELAKYTPGQGLSWY